MLSALNNMMPSKIEIALQDMLDGKQIDSKFIMAEFSRLKLKIDQQEQVHYTCKYLATWDKKSYLKLGIF